MPALKALPGRVILKFPSPTEQTVGGIIVPETSQQRPEFGEIFDVGAAIDDRQEFLRRTFLELRKAGIKIAVSFAAGTSYWQQNYDAKVYGWIKDYRSYRMEELAALLVEDDELAAAMAK